MLLRRILLYLSAAGWARRLVSSWSAARRVARRFVAGETLDEAMQAVKTLNAKQLAATLDYLGESVRHADDTQEVVSTYRTLLERIQREGLRATVSLKLTHMGLDISEELCVANLRHILTEAQRHNIAVTIDMESSAYTDRTLRLYRTMRDEYDFKAIGTVIQAYLRRSAADMVALGAEGAHVRLCKGAYLEPPTVAFPEKSEVDANYVQVMEQFLLSSGYLCIATHDENMIAAAEKFARERKLSTQRYEFQMLYGVRPGKQEALAAAGYVVRVYVPFGSAWYPYFMRRLAERPANLWFFIRSLFRP
jgi:proline dehydrogenase